MTTPDEKKFLKDAERYLSQQQDLFGNILYTERQEQPQIQSAVSEELPLYPKEPWTAAASLREMEEQICTCMKCPLGQTRNMFVFGDGNPHAGLMFIGEAPGADEDAQGKPFVGRAGQLLTKIIEAIQMKREDVYICNILKCRPPNNRRPAPTEVDLCTPYLNKQIELVRPKFIICLGLTAAQWLLQTNASLATLRGKFHDFRGTRLLVTYHPAALLRNPEWKKPTWEDMKMLKSAYEGMTA
ncbi:MAG TPA: uracil-DNA glycosylase family protein [Bacteroidota bacterium]|nr:uracil-DNA glycosylase family protein [Bacteroidota bacterium]